MSSSAFVRVPRLAGPNPFRVISRSTPYSCLGRQPANVIVQRGVLPRSGLPVTVHGLDWYEDPRGDCGRCPACVAVRTAEGVWVAMYAVD